MGALLVAAAAVAFTGRSSSTGEVASASGCAPGYVDRAARAARIERERLAERAYPGSTGEESVADVDDELRAEGPLTRLEREPECVPLKRPESRGELMRVQSEVNRRNTSPLDRVRPGAQRAALRTRAQIARAGRALPGGDGTWEPVGKTPLIQDDPTYPSVAGSGGGDYSGRISSFAADPSRRRVFAAVGEGGVWMTDDLARSWRPIGDSLPTNTVGAIGWTPAGGGDGTVIVLTGNDVFGGGNNYAGLGAYRTTDLGRTWQKSSGIPDNVISVEVQVDPTNPNLVYAATGAGLFRSEDAGATFTNVRLPVSEGVAAGQPDCTGAPPEKEGCFLANMVTDVVVTPADNEATADGSNGARGGSVVAAVGWRASDKTSPPSKGFPEGYVESPGNGVYRSDTGAAGSFKRAGTSGLPEKSRLGRMELSNARGPQQDHNHLYVIVEDAVRFNGGAPVIDVPTDQTGPIPNPTTLNGVYVSADLGDTWEIMTTAEELQSPTTGSSLALTNCATLYCPGVQAWYNQFIEVDPTRQSGGVPTRLVFGLEEVWQNADTTQPQNTKSTFRVIGPYASGTSCVGLTIKFPVCPFTAGNPLEANFTTHADQHAALWLTNDRGGASLFVGNDGGAYVQEVTGDTSNPELSPDRWTRGENVGFHTLLPYDAQVAKDGTIYAGLQDNGEMKIEPSGRQVGVYGGDGAFSAVEPDDSNTAYESYTNNDIRVTRDGGRNWTDIPPPSDTYQFINPFVMDPTDPKHLLTAGTSVYERLQGPEGDWVSVFDLGTRTKPGDAAAAAGTGDPNNLVSAVDVRGAAGYVAYCGACDALNARPFANGIATNVSPDGKVGKKGAPDNWHIAKADGLPERYITSVQIDPAEPRTIYVTLGGYSRRWLPVGVLGEKEADLRKGNVWKSTDAGETFRSVSGNLPDGPANWTALRQGRLIVATTVGVFQSENTDGGAYEVLGKGLPPVNVLTLEMKPKATASEPDTMIVATHGRGVYRYVFKDPQAAPVSAPQPPCAATSALQKLSLKRSGRGLRIGFTRGPGSGRVGVDVFQHSGGAQIFGERLVARFTRKARGFTWNGRANRRNRKVGDGYYSVRLRVKQAGGRVETRRYTFERVRGRFVKRPPFYRRQTCGTLSSFKLERPVFGGRTNRAMYVSALVSKRAQVRMEFRRNGKVVARTPLRTRRAGATFRERFDSDKRPRGVYTVVIHVTQGDERVVARLSARRL